MQRNGLVVKKGIDQDQHQHGEQEPDTVGHPGTDPLRRPGKPDCRDGPAKRSKKGRNFSDKGHFTA